MQMNTLDYVLYFRINHPIVWTSQRYDHNNVIKNQTPRKTSSWPYHLLEWLNTVLEMIKLWETSDCKRCVCLFWCCKPTVPLLCDMDSNSSTEFLQLFSDIVVSLFQKNGTIDNNEIKILSTNQVVINYKNCNNISVVFE